MTTTTAWQCDPTGRFVGETTVQEDAFEQGTYLLPPNCTLQPPPAFDPATQLAVLVNGAWTIQAIAVAPTSAPATSDGPATDANKPDVGANQIAVIIDGMWTVVADFRGTTYWLADGSEHRIIAIGEMPPADALPSPPPAQPATPEVLTLAQAQSAQVVTLQATYKAAIQQPVKFTTSAGATDQFSADTDSVGNLEAMLTAYASTQSFPLNLWLNTAGAPVTPFTYADLQGLAETIANQATPDYQELLQKISAVMASTTVDAVQAIVW